MNLRLARALYSAAWWPAAPLVALYLLWRGLRQREYRLHWAERFLGAGPQPPAAATEILWVHAVSVGESRAAQPLIERLTVQRPRAHFVLTHMTPTGRAVGEAFAQSMPGRVTVRYLPYEFGFALRRFVREVRPALGIVMETEVWPNLLFAAREAALPVVLVNARLSEKSLARARRLDTLIRAAAAGFARIVAQTEADRARLATLFRGPIDVAGNLKFDLAPSPELVDRGRALRGDRPIILLASSRDGEEALFLDALANQKSVPDPDFKETGAEAGIREASLRAAVAASACKRETPPGTDFWVVPRHPQRFDEVERLFESRGVAVMRRSQLGKKSGSGTDFPVSVFLGDSMGEMAMYYALADVTIMGGSFLPFGSQNLIESCAVGTPVIVGPSSFNFSQVVDDAVAAGAALSVATMDDALAAADALIRDQPRLELMRAAALGFSQRHRGATARTAAILVQLLASRLSAPAAR